MWEDIPNTEGVNAWRRVSYLYN